MRGLLGGGVLNPDTLTIGFARRFATYKRATLLLSQPERLMALLNDADRPVQFVFAGKAHPADTPGKELIQKIEQFARKAGVRHRFVFLADYDMAIAREMYHGCDVWLNTPRRPLEACGTSGMKAALNGALNCSILDGWWDECYAPGVGWAIESADDDPDLERRDLRECASLYAVLEEQVIPRFYEHTSGGLPRAWLEMVQEAWATLGPRVTAARMVRDYTTELYEPAAAAARSLSAARRYTRRRARRVATQGAGGVAVRGDHVARRRHECRRHRRQAAGHGHRGDGRPRSWRPARRRPPRHGRPRRRVPPRAGDGDVEPAGDGNYRGELVLTAPGSYGVTARVIPVHPALGSPYELGLATWAG